MKTSIILFVFLVFSVSVLSQEITIVTQNNDFISAKQETEFYYITKILEKPFGAKVADVNLQIQREGKKNSLNDTFYALWKQANTMGANSFLVSEINYSDEKKLYDIVVELWFLDNEKIEDNLNLYPSNLIVVLGDINTKNENKGKKIKLNGEKNLVMPYQFFIHQNTVGERAKINVGGFTGATVSFLGKENRLPVFVSLGGGSVAPQSRGNQVGVSVSTGSMAPVDMNFGLFLMDVLR